MEDFSSKYFRGQGKMFVGDIDANGNPINLKFLGDCSAATATPNVSRGQHVESVTGGRAVAASWINSIEYAVSFTLHSVRKDHLAQALQGVATSKVGASVTDEAHTAYHDGFVLLDHNKISTATVTDDAATPVTYTVDVDYIVHADEGMVEILSTGAIPDESAIEVSYTYAAQDHITSAPGNTAKYVVFAGKNTANNDKQTRAEMYKVKLDPSALDMINTEAAAMTLSGIAEIDTSRPAGDQVMKWKNEA